MKMKKTLIAIAAIAALGTGIISAQAETGYLVNEDFGIADQMNSTVPAAGEAFLTNDGHNF
jgi:hypothetical protein